MTSNHNNRQRSLKGQFQSLNHPILLKSVVPNVMNPSNGSQPISPPSGGSLKLTEPTDMNNSQLLSQSPTSQQTPSQSQSPKKPTGSLAGSAATSKAVDRKLTADELKFSTLETDVGELMQSIAGILIMIGAGTHKLTFTADGMIVAKHAASYTHTLVAMAKKYEWMYDALHAVTEVGVWGEILTETASMAVSIAVIHGMTVPQQVPGAVEGVEALGQANQLMTQLQLQQQLQQQQEEALAAT